MSAARACIAGVCLGYFSVAGLACDGGAGTPPPAGQQTTTAKLATGRTAADENARASAYSARAARYRQLSDENKEAVAGLTRDIAKQAEIAIETRTPVTVALPGPAGGIDEATIAPAAVRAKRQAAADLADRLAAGAQKVADLHTRRAAELNARAGGGEARR
jgi:hypothetical protein